MKKTISILLVCAFVLSTMLSFVSFAEVGTLDLGKTAGGELAALAGVELTEGGAALDYDGVCALYEAAAGFVDRFSEVVLPEAMAGLRLTVGAFDKGKLAALTEDAKSLSEDDLHTLYAQAMNRRLAISAVFWELVVAYLPDGAADRIVHDDMRNILAQSAAIADGDKAGTWSLADAYAVYGKGAREDFPFDNIVFIENGIVLYCDGENSGEKVISDATIYNVISAAGAEINRRLNERNVHGFHIADGEKLNAKLVVELMKFIVGEESSIDEYTADFNGSGKINAKDVVDMMKYIIGR